MQEIMHLRENKMIYYTLSGYIDALKECGIYVGDTLSDSGKTVRYLSFDSRDIKEDTLFIAKGLHFREEYLDSAMKNGACAYVAQAQIGGRPESITVTDIRLAMTVLAQKFWNDPQRYLHMFGITGTKGKTTTSAYLRRILDLDAEKNGRHCCGIMNSTDMFDGEKRIASLITTPEAPDFWKCLAAGAENGVGNFVCECSSQAFKYGRVARVHFDIACITNVGCDHISAAEHADWEDYFTSKLKIFDLCRTAVINIDDEHADRTLAYVRGRRRIITFGSTPEADVYSRNISKKSDGIYFETVTPEGVTPMKLSMLGLFNVKNAVAATAMAYAAGIPAQTCAEALADIKILGRMTDLSSKDGKVAVLVDHAHNKLSFETLFDSVEQEFPGRDYIVVFGWNGSKVYDRRRDVGTITGRRAALTVICEWDSNDEPFEHIAEEAASWIEKAGGKYVIVRDRAEAFGYAVNVPVSGDKRLILFCGRGDEDFQRKGGKIYPYPLDVDIASAALEEYDRCHG